MTKTLGDLSSKELLYLKSDLNYTIFHFIDGKKKVSSYTLKFHENSPIGYGFLRINNSYLANPEYIEEINKKGNTAEVRLLDGTKIKASRRRQVVLKTLITSVVFSILPGIGHLF